MEQIIVNGITIEQLLDKIGYLFDDKLRNIPPDKKEVESEFLKRSEVCMLLKITPPTLKSYCKMGWLQSYKIGNRVLYKAQEIEEAIKNLAIIKYKKNCH